MIVVPELDNNNISKVGVNPANSTLLSYIVIKESVEVQVTCIK